MSRLTQSQGSTLKTVTPVVTMGITWGVRKGLAAAYTARTGRSAPVVADRTRSILSRVLWAASVTAVVVLIESIVLDALTDAEQETVEA